MFRVLACWAGRVNLGSSFVVLLWGMLFLLPGVALSQQFDVTVTSEKALPTRLTLAVFVNDSVPVTLNPTQLANRSVSFAGKLSAPMYAELRSPQMDTPLCFFLENSSVQIVLNAANPKRSKVTGSRVNSLYRFALEQTLEDTIFLRDHLLKNPSEVYNPCLLLGALSILSPSQAQHYSEMLEGRASRGYAYLRLKEQLSTLVSTMEGEQMPDFQYSDRKGNTANYNTIRADSICTVILVGATWCEQCNNIEQQLLSLEKEYVMRHIEIPLDKHPKAWNAPYLKQLAVDHIPYLILVDNHGVIYARDIRIWQLARTLDEMGTPKKVTSKNST